MTLEPIKILKQAIPNWNSLSPSEKRGHISNFKRLLFPTAKHVFASFNVSYGTLKKPKNIKRINTQHVKIIQEVYKINILDFEK